MRAKVGGFFLKTRERNSNGVCPLCNIEQETMPHMVVDCTANGHEIPDENVRNIDNVFGWLVSIERTSVERNWIDNYIYVRWKNRCGGRIPPPIMRVQLDREEEME